MKQWPDTIEETTIMQKVRQVINVACARRKFLSGVHGLTCESAWRSVLNSHKEHSLKKINRESISYLYFPLVIIYWSLDVIHEGADISHSCHHSCITTGNGKHNRENNLCLLATMSSSAGSDVSGSESDGDGSDGSGRRGRSPEEIRRDNRRLLRENLQLKKRIRMKDFNLRQMGAYAASGGNKTAVVSNLDDNAVQQSLRACLATCCMIANWMRVDVTPFYKWATAGWINWSTNHSTSLPRDGPRFLYVWGGTGEYD